MSFETPAHTDELFESNARRGAEARLHHLIELKGIGLITGEVGSGKTTVCRHIASALHPGLYRVGYVSLTTGNVLDMYKAIAWELGLPPERSRATDYLVHRLRLAGCELPLFDPPPSRRWRTARADCPGASIASPTTPSPPPPRQAPAPSPPCTSITPSRSCGCEPV